MLLKEDATAQRLRGSYYTNHVLAKYITSWALNGATPNVSILEPSCGDGVFLQAVPSTYRESAQILAIEIDESEALKASHCNLNTSFFNSFSMYKARPLLNDNVPNISVICDDFYKVYKEKLVNEQYDCIIGNPPYIRYQYLMPSQREEQNEILINNGLKSNKLINAWVSFFVACISILSNTGKIGFVIPAEILQVAYATDLRKYITKELNEVTILTFEELVFDGVEQEIVVLLGEKNNSLSHKHRIVQCKNVNDLLTKTNLSQYKFASRSASDSDGKWTKFLLDTQEQSLLVQLKSNLIFRKLKDFAKLEVGITTGNNDYFCVSKDVVDRYDLSSVALPLVARSVNVDGIVFTKSDWAANVNNGAKTYLLDFNNLSFNDLSDKQKAYIHMGENSDQHKGYKCSIRDNWYQIPSIWKPDAFFLRRNYLYPKIVLNSTDIDAVSTDTMHRVRVYHGIDVKRFIVSFYNSISFALSELEGRSYGGGVLEILPSEAGNILIPDIQSPLIVSDEIIDKIFCKIDKCIRENAPFNELLDIVDMEILQGKLNINRKDILSFRTIWKKLQTRRLGRGGRN